MHILLIGSGGREHALAKAIKESPGTGALYCTPGNPGIFQLAEKARLNPDDFQAVKEFCKNYQIGMVVVGPEQPLADGIADYLAGNGIAVFGPSQKAARLESSKGFAKEFMRKYSIPTAEYMTFPDADIKLAHDYLDSRELPVVIKADGLAAGKGVIIAETAEAAHEALDDMFGGKFGEAGNTVVIEDFMQGEEASILAISDGTDFVTLASSQDHKRAFDGDEGPNTGGMGAYAPAPVVTGDIIKEVHSEVIKPAIDGMANEGSPFIGCLYAGLMIKDGGVKVVEFNVRFGDPETQAVLAVFRGDFAGLLYSAAIGKLDKSKVVSKSEGSACAVVLASSGYPGSYGKGHKITGIEDAEEGGAIVYQAGTGIGDNGIVTAGGRVLAVTGVGRSLKQSIDNAYAAVDKISFNNKYFRKDIGSKGLK